MRYLLPVCKAINQRWSKAIQSTHFIGWKNFFRLQFTNAKLFLFFFHCYLIYWFHSVNSQCFSLRFFFFLFFLYKFSTPIVDNYLTLCFSIIYTIIPSQSLNLTSPLRANRFLITRWKSIWVSKKCTTNAQPTCTTVVCRSAHHRRWWCQSVALCTPKNGTFVPQNGLIVTFQTISLTTSVYKITI